MPLICCFPYHEPHRGMVFAVGELVGGLHIGIGYAEGAWDSTDHWRLDEPFDAGWFGACHGSIGVCRRLSADLTGPLPKATHTLCEVPRLPWMDVRREWIVETREELKALGIDLPPGGHTRFFGGPLW